MKPYLKLAAIPALFILLSHGMSLKMFPLYSAGAIYNADPSYMYLFNGLLLLDRHVPYHIDHPGTPLQMLVALVVYLQWTWAKIFSTTDPDVVVAAIANPEFYLLTISRVLLCLNAMALYFFGSKIHASAKSMFLAVFCQSSVLTYGLISTKLLYPAPEALVVGVSLCMLGVLSPLIFDQNQSDQTQKKLAIYAGLLYGLGFAIKLTFLPMAGLFLLFKGWRHIGTAAVSALVAWLVGISPILKRLPDFWNWIFNMATHVGKYGSGGKGIVDYSLLEHNFFELARAFPVFYLALLVCAGFLLYLLFYRLRHIQSNTPQTRIAIQNLKVALIVLVVCIGQTLIVMKHFGEHYMLPALPLVIVGLALFMHSLFKLRPQFRLLIQTVVALSALAFVVQSNYATFQELKASRIRHLGSNAQVQNELAKYQNPLLIGSYGCYLRQCGLILGIEFAPAIDKKIGRQLANYYSFNVFAKMLVIDGHGYYPLTVLSPFLTEQRPIFLLTQIDMAAFDVFEKELVLTAEKQKLYRITGLAK